MGKRREIGLCVWMTEGMKGSEGTRGIYTQLESTQEGEESQSYEFCRRYRNTRFRENYFKLVEERIK